MRIVILNPNTTAAFTDRLEALGRRIAAPNTAVAARSPGSGVPSVECHADEAVAAAALLPVIAEEEQRGTDGYVIACFGDTGLDAAREVASGPVVGMTEAALYAAAMLAPVFSIVTLPPRTIVHAARAVRHAGLSHRCARIRAIDVHVDDCVAPGAALLAAMIAESRAAIREDAAEAIILGCAGLAELVAPMSQALGLPVVDGVTVALKMAEGLVAAGLRTSKASSYK